MARRFFEGVNHSAIYAKFRPVPPPSLISSIIEYLQLKCSRSSLLSAVDVGCGSGQSTHPLAPHFTHILGVDVSPAQVAMATDTNTLSNISYKETTAENLPVPDQSVQLVTAGQSCHWFDMVAFNGEVDRVLTADGVVALYGYLLPCATGHPQATAVTALMNQMYDVETAGCWGEDRVHVDTAYCDERFKLPYEDCVRDDSQRLVRRLSVAQLTGSIQTWSGFQEMANRKGEQHATRLLTRFADSVCSELGSAASAEDTMMEVTYPYFLIMGRKPSQHAPSSV